MVFSYICILVFLGLLFLTQDSLILNEYLMFDCAGVFLSFISILFMIFFLHFCGCYMSNLEFILILISSIFSIICFLSNDTLVFWVTYELAILPIVFCMLIGSPYSERFLAFWYLAGYIGLTSLPLLLTILYVNTVTGTTSLASNTSMEFNGGLLVGVILLILFSTKVPLPPFHSWLPVVHAEASTFISICLSGFIMKLGIIGIYRFVVNLVIDNSSLGSVLLCYSVLVIASCIAELDTKRWLAYLSLGHIIIAIVGIIKNENIPSEAVLYCLGHGFSASLLFGVFLLVYELFGSRNWFSFSMSGRLGMSLGVILGGCLLTASSFPPTLNFFSEIFILGLSFDNIGLVFSYFFYLFVGGLVPVLILSYLVCSFGESHGNSRPPIGLLLAIYVFCLVCYLVVFLV
nr:NADH dehydrogenase subunit 4 [Cichlidogyrus thurstonae]